MSLYTFIIKFKAKEWKFQTFILVELTVDQMTLLSKLSICCLDVPIQATAGDVYKWPF